MSRTFSQNLPYSYQPSIPPQYLQQQHEQAIQAASSSAAGQTHHHHQLQDPGPPGLVHQKSSPGSSHSHSNSSSNAFAFTQLTTPLTTSSSTGASFSFQRPSTASSTRRPSTSYSQSFSTTTTTNQRPHTSGRIALHSYDPAIHGQRPMPSPPPSRREGVNPNPTGGGPAGGGAGGEGGANGDEYVKSFAAAAAAAAAEQQHRQGGGPGDGQGVPQHLGQAYPGYGPPPPPTAGGAPFHPQGTEHIGHPLPNYPYPPQLHTGPYDPHRPPSGYMTSPFHPPPPLPPGAYPPGAAAGGGQMPPHPSSLQHQPPQSASDPAGGGGPPPGHPDHIPVGVSGGKLFKCMGYGDCQAVFTRSEHLARHVRKHTGDRPFPCHCNKQFSRLDNLRQHASTVHADTPELNERMLRALAPVHAALSQKAGKEQRKRGEIVEIPRSAIPKRIVPPEMKPKGQRGRKSKTGQGQQAAPGDGGLSMGMPPYQHQPHPDQPIAGPSGTHGMAMLPHDLAIDPALRGGSSHGMMGHPPMSAGAGWTDQRPGSSHRPPTTTADMRPKTGGPSMMTPQMRPPTAPGGPPGSASAMSQYSQQRDEHVRFDPFPYGIRPGSNKTVAQQLQTGQPPPRQTPSKSRPSSVMIAKQESGDRTEGYQAGGMMQHPPPPNSALSSNFGENPASTAPPSLGHYSDGDYSSMNPSSYPPTTPSFSLPPHSAHSFQPAFQPPHSANEFGSEPPASSAAFDMAYQPGPLPYPHQRNLASQTGGSHGSSGTSGGNSSQSRAGQSQFAQMSIGGSSSGIPGAATPSQIQEIYGNGPGAQESPFSYHPPPTATNPPSTTFGGGSSGGFPMSQAYSMQGQTTSSSMSVSPSSRRRDQERYVSGGGGPGGDFSFGGGESETSARMAKMSRLESGDAPPPEGMFYHQPPPIMPRQERRPSLAISSLIDDTDSLTGNSKSRLQASNIDTHNQAFYEPNPTHSTSMSSFSWGNAGDQQGPGNSSGGYHGSGNGGNEMYGGGGGYGGDESNDHQQQTLQGYNDEMNWSDDVKTQHEQQLVGAMDAKARALLEHGAYEM